MAHCITLKKNSDNDGLQKFIVDGEAAYPSDFGEYDPDTYAFSPLPLDIPPFGLSMESCKRVQDILQNFIGLYPFGLEIVEEVQFSIPLFWFIRKEFIKCVIAFHSLEIINFLIR